MDKNSRISLHSGNKMPLLGLGTWKLTGGEATRSVKDALKMGYHMVDTSGDYNNQREVGEGIRQSGIKRENLFLVTKVEEDDDAYQAVKNNLNELGLEYADLILIHRPPQHGVGEELWDGLIRAKDEGLTRDIGVSNYSIDQIDELIDASDEVPVVNQIEWSPFGHSKDMLKYCEDNDIIIQAYSPLTRAEHLDDAPINDLADKYEKTPAEIMIRWNIQHHVVPLIKSTTTDHLTENLNVFDFELQPEDIERLDGLNREFSALGPKPQYIG
jgi:2,5-diketo-D-gluconate reductase A